MNAIRLHCQSEPSRWATGCGDTQSMESSATTQASATAASVSIIRIRHKPVMAVTPLRLHGTLRRVLVARRFPHHLEERKKLVLRRGLSLDRPEGSFSHSPECKARLSKRRQMPSFCSSVALMISDTGVPRWRCVLSRFAVPTTMRLRVASPFFIRRLPKRDRSVSTYTKPGNVLQVHCPSSIVRSPASPSNPSRWLVPGSCQGRTH